jgi:hypothetical protein
MDRRAVFFALSAIVCGLLLWPTPAELEWAGITLVVWFSVLAVASWLDARSIGRPHRAPRRRS